LAQRKSILKLIEKIEIHYLRSLYSATFSDVGDLNIVFGRNDSGKSNCLRALSLFFDDEPDSDRKFNFDLDMSDKRIAEPRSSIARQFVWIKVTFNVPENYKKSLGTQIYVKKQWNRDGIVNMTFSPSIKSTNQKHLTRFLKSIDFTYVPAIKDLNVYAELIERMYSSAAETDTMKSAIEQFIGAIASQTNDLATELTNLFSSQTAIAPPTEMARIFRNLDFAHGDDGHSMFRQKGDGIKARHLPEFIRFINKKEVRKKIFIWGFEEPENSLDLNAAKEEAQRFARFSESVDTQIFITSHSPAFYLADNETGKANLRKYFITKQEPDENGTMEPSDAVSKIDRVEDAEKAMNTAGLLQLPFVIKQLSELETISREKEKENSELESKINDLKSEIATANKPVLFVEGDNDAKLFNATLARLGVKDDIVIKIFGTAPSKKEDLLKRIMDQGGLSTNQKSMFLFDNDQAGRKAARTLCDNIDTISQANFPNGFVGLLPHTDEFKAFIGRHQINADQAFLPLNFFSRPKIALDYVMNSLKIIMVQMTFLVGIRH
jgi:predicted ATP-dependent endonuclease of OLD family